MATPILDQLLEEAQTLSEQEAADVLQIIQTIKRRAQNPYDSSKDRTIGLISGPTNVAERVEEILEDDVKRRGGWTQKDPE